MKNLILIVCFFLIGNTTKAQTGILDTDFSCQKISDNEYHFIFNTSFSIGSGSDCPPLVYHTITIENNILNVKAFYDTTGLWSQEGCNRSDTVIYNNTIPLNINLIELSTNAIGYNNIPPYIPSTLIFENIYSQTFNVTSLSNNNFNRGANDIKVYPNPTQGNVSISTNINFYKVAIINNLGQIVESFKKNKSDNYDLQDIQDGLYYMVYYDVNNKKIGESKILKSK
jgi:hypothetical protein